MHGLKTSFELKDFELPHEYEEERLKFSFARCLEAAVAARPSGIAGQVTSKKKKYDVSLI